MLLEQDSSVELVEMFRKFRTLQVATIRQDINMNGSSDIFGWQTTSAFGRTFMQFQADRFLSLFDSSSAAPLASRMCIASVMVMGEVEFRHISSFGEMDLMLLMR